MQKYFCNMLCAWTIHVYYHPEIPLFKNVFFPFVSHPFVTISCLIQNLYKELIMKNILKLLTLLVFVIGITGCHKDDDIKTQDYFEPLEQDSVFFNVSEGEQTLSLKCSE